MSWLEFFCGAAIFVGGVIAGWAIARLTDRPGGDDRGTGR